MISKIDNIIKQGSLFVSTPFIIVFLTLICLNQPLLYASQAGLNRVVLRKNIINGVNTLTQEMVNKPNTIYVIQEDYDLATSLIKMQENCILDFNGGSLNNGSLDANNCDVIGLPKFNLKKVGVLKGKIYNLSWFTVANNDYSELLQDIVDKSYRANETDMVEIVVPQGIFVISKLFVANQNNQNIRQRGRFTIKGHGNKSVIDINGGSGIKLAKHFLIEDISVTGATSYPAITLGKQADIQFNENSIINRCDFYGNTAGAIESTDFLLNLNISNCYFTGNNNKNGAICSLKGNSSTTFRVTKCYFSNNNSAKECLYLNGNTNINIIDNVFESSGLIIDAVNCNYLNVDANYFEFATDYYIKVDNNSEVVRISNNMFRYSVVSKPYIYLRNINKKIIENNRFDGWSNVSQPALGHFDFFDITDLVCNNNIYNSEWDIITRFESGKSNIEGTGKNKKTYSSFQNGSKLSNGLSKTDRNNYVDYVDNIGFYDNQSYKVCITSKLLSIPNTNYQYRANKRYVVSFYMKQDPSSKMSRVNMHFTGSVSVGSQIIDFGKSYDWKRYQFEFIPSGNSSISVYFGPYAYADGKPCVFYIDDLQIEEKQVGFAAPYSVNN